MKNFHYLIWVFGYSLLLINYGCSAMPNNKNKLENKLENTLNICPDKPLGTLSKDDVKRVSLNNQLVKYSGLVHISKNWGYIFDGESGQQLTYQTKDNICIWVYTPDNQLLTRRELPKTGKYTVQIAALKGSTTFDVEMSLKCQEKPTGDLESRNVKQISLSSTEILKDSGQARAGQYIGYAFEAKSGQELSYRTEDNICVWVYAPDNQLLNSGVLPKTGKYTIQVSALKGSTTFELAMGLDVVLPSPTNERNSSRVTSRSTTATTPNVSTPRKTTAAQISLSNFPKSTCGDPLPTNPNDYPVDFYPVFVPDNESNLQLARSRFCRDALLRKRKDTGIRAVQVASFTSQQRAIEFRNILNSEFRGADIGPPTTIPNQP